MFSKLFHAQIHKSWGLGGGNKVYRNIQASGEKKNENRDPPTLPLRLKTPTTLECKTHQFEFIPHSHPAPSSSVGTASSKQDTPIHIEVQLKVNPFLSKRERASKFKSCRE